MAPISSIAILAASLLGAMAAPRPVTTAIPVTNIPKLKTPYSGYATWFDDYRNACPGIQYSFNEPIAAVNAAMFNSAQKNGASVCGKYVKVNLKGDTSSNFTFKVVDTCPECDDTSLDFSKVAIEQFTDAGIVAIDWELVEPPVTIYNTTVSITAPMPTATTKSSAKSDKDQDTNTNTETESNEVFSGRGTWFSDTMGSCGVKFSQQEMIVALNEEQMGSMWGEGSKCGQKISVRAKDSSKSVVVRIVDTCPEQYCSHGELDLSQAAFEIFAPKSKGILELEWSFV